MDINRKTAYAVLMDVEEKQSYSNLALNHHVIVNKPDSPSFVRELVYGVLENKIYLDHLIASLVKNPASKIRKSDRTLLRMGLYQLEFMNSVPPYAAVNESVNLAKRFARGRDGFINGVLRGYLRKNGNIPLPDRDSDPVTYLSVKYSYEPWIIQLWLEEYDISFVEDLLEAGNRTPEMTVRANALKTTKDALAELLEEGGYQVEEGVLTSAALRVKGSEILSTDLYREGLFSVQDESSMHAVELLDPQPGELVIDVCAAPGGKTLYIAERMENRGRIIAGDIYPRKLDLIKKEAKRTGAEIIATKPWDAAKTDEAFVGQADRVLVDAPCSGLGVVRRKPEIKYKKQDLEMRNLPLRQLDILEASCRYVKAGGILVYSTCTISIYENQRIIGDFIRKNPEFSILEKMQLLPNINGTDGFYICKMQKE